MQRIYLRLRVTAILWIIAGFAGIAVLLAKSVGVS